MDKDLQARQQAREMLRVSEAAQKILGRFSQERLDAIVKAAADAFAAHGEELARMAVEETGFGNVQDKILKNRFASQRVWEKVKDLRTVGVLNRQDGEKLWEVGVPVGVIAAIVPSTNPTSTVCYKSMIALKSGNTVIFSPHPKAVNCTRKAAEIMAEAALKAGAPEGCIQCLDIPAMSGCQELMTAPETRLILATGGPAMVKAAYSSGKPAIGVGAGNGPAYIHPTADVDHALCSILRSKTFDNGTVCASEQSIIVEKSMEQSVKAAAQTKGFYFMTPGEADVLAALLFRPNGALNPAIVGKPAEKLAEMAGISVPAGTKILVAQAGGVGERYPYSMEKLCPVLGWYAEENEDAVLAKCREILLFEGAGHTFCMHAQDEKAIEKFAMEMPVSRFLVNTPGALGGIGDTTGLFPALTLGCGAVGGSSSSNNIGPMDLVNIRRVAWDRQEPSQNTGWDSGLVDILTAKILEKLK